jgi:hypothetical protein
MRHHFPFIAVIDQRLKKLLYFETVILTYFNLGVSYLHLMLLPTRRLENYRGLDSPGIARQLLKSLEFPIIGNLLPVLGCCLRHVSVPHL